MSDAADIEAPVRRGYRSAGRDEQKQQTRARILESALTHFSQRGFEAASVRDISAEAGVTHAVIRLHFGGKESLWQAAIGKLFERQRQELGYPDALRRDRFTAEDLRGFIHRYVAYCARHPEHFRIMIHETLRDTERVRWLVATHIKPNQANLVRLLKRAIEDGILPDAPLPSLMYILTSASQTMFALGAEARHLWGLDVNDPQVVSAHAEAIWSMLNSGRGQDAAAANTGG